MFKHVVRGADELRALMGTPTERAFHDKLKPEGKAREACERESEDGIPADALLR